MLEPASNTHCKAVHSNLIETKNQTWIHTVYIKNGYRMNSAEEERKIYFYCMSISRDGLIQTSFVTKREKKIMHN